MQDRPVILGIHGLANKPPRDEKQKWWEAAIREGLARNLGHDPSERLRFDFVYWADLRYGEPVTAGRNREPYYPARGRGPFPSPEAGPPPGPTLTDRVYRVLEWLQEKSGRLLVDDVFIEYRLDDLWGYYKDAAFRDAARERLRAALAQHAGRPLLLAAHSMGSLIAYDVLRLLEADGAPPRRLHLVTMGAPLGLAEVKHRIDQEHGGLRVPAAVARWTNLSDRDDVATVGAALDEAYGPNAAGVRPVEHRVINAYRRPRGGTNPHKSYGYLRTPQFSRAVAAFLADETAEARVEAEASA
ncbi:thioesterase domain-containing protein [Methylobacterium sp. Leaf118]|uniref:thioesterase domain-containing protein n=1 Tax=Methylobacterium sp. Leaf118 TaxID=2876562 RepID=UPI001E57270B|nr:thioesterase domain-containing protein [Methylobacterium sp. Leaf118]